MSEDKFIMFRNRLLKVYRHVSKQAQRQGVSCYRVYDHDLPEFPFCIEIYSDRLYVAEYKRRHGLSEEAHENWIAVSLDIMSEVLQVSKENIFLKLRQRKPGRLGQYQKLDTAKNELIVEENGLQFIVNLGDYLDTGLFLDHRLTRQKVREEAAGKNVLNLFAYTGSFSVYAAAGGASEVVTVDLSNTYINWAKRNMLLNGFVNEAAYSFLPADVFRYLESAPEDHFDLIIMDPPTFSNSKKMKDILDIQRDHVLLINGCLKSLVKGGRLYFSTNYRDFKLDTASINSISIKDITKATTAFDFEEKLGRCCYLFSK
jgi:23S rRNA (cytosine1962-C5)-methyltransferase